MTIIHHIFRLAVTYEASGKLVVQQIMLASSVYPTKLMWTYICVVPNPFTSDGISIINLSGKEMPFYARNPPGKVSLYKSLVPMLEKWAEGIQEMCKRSLSCSKHFLPRINTREMECDSYIHTRT